MIDAAHFFKTNVHVKANSRSRMDTVIYYDKYRRTSLNLSVFRAMAPSIWWGVTAWKILLRGGMMRGRGDKGWGRGWQRSPLLPRA